MLIISIDKTRIADYAQECRGFKTVTLVNAGWFLEDSYMEKYVIAYGGFAKRVDEEGYLTLKVPRWGNDPELVPWLACEKDYGDIVQGVFLDPAPWNGKMVHGVSQCASFHDYIQAFVNGESLTG